MVPDSHDGCVADVLARIPIFASLESRSRVALEEGVRLERCSAGDMLVRQGEYSEDVYFLREGTVSVDRRRVDGMTVHVGYRSVDEWFGEMPALANQPHPVSVRAETPCLHVVMGGVLFRKIMASDRTFRDRIDDRYRQRVLAYHLRAVPLFRGVGSEALRWVASRASIRAYPSDSVIAHQGEVASSVFLVRKGVVKRVESREEDSHIAAYHCDNSTFGARSLTPDPIWPQTFVAMGRVELVEIAAHVLENLGEVAGEDARCIQETANEFLSIAGTELEARHHPSRRSRIAPIDLMMRKQSAREGEALVIDMGKCIRCHRCLASCADVHEDGIARLSRQGRRVGRLALATACNYCHVPECMLGCTYGAIRRGSSGRVNFIYANCTGCGVCEIKCPHNIIRMTPGEAALPVKCDHCAGLPFEACVYNCPCGAISHVSPEVLIS